MSATGMPSESMLPVDINGAFVPQEKDASDNIEKASEANLIRFGLTEDGL